MSEFKEIIKDHLDNMAKKDGNFAQIYRKENKNIDECVDYIMSEMRKKGNAVGVKDEVVYGLAVHYYEEDSIKDIKPIAEQCKVSTSRRKVELTDEEREKLKEEVRQEFKDNYRKEISETRSANNEVADVSEIEVPSMF